MSGDIISRLRFLRDFRGGREKAEALIALARENGFSTTEALASVFVGYTAVHEGAIDDGVKAMLQGMETMRAAGEITALQVSNDWLAEACLTARQPAEGLAAVNEAIGAADQLRLRFYEADLHRLKGELLLLAGAPESQAEQSLRRAMRRRPWQLLPQVRRREPETKRFCGDCGAPLAAGSPAARSTATPGLASAINITAEPGSGEIPDGERKTVTALFADIKGSTELMEDLEPRGGSTDARISRKRNHVHEAFCGFHRPAVRPARTGSSNAAAWR
jgi:hypothetical protein